MEHELRQYLLAVGSRSQDRKFNSEIKVEFASFILDQFIDLGELVELEIARKYGSLMMRDSDGCYCCLSD